MIWFLLVYRCRLPYCPRLWGVKGGEAYLVEVRTDRAAPSQLFRGGRGQVSQSESVEGSECFEVKECQKEKRSSTKAKAIWVSFVEATEPD